MTRLPALAVLAVVSVVGATQGCALDQGFDGFGVEGEGEFNTAITAPKALTFHVIGSVDPQRYFVPVVQDGAGFGGVVDVTVGRAAGTFSMAISEEETATLNGINYFPLLLGDVASAGLGGGGDGFVDGFFFGLSSTADVDIDLTMRATVQLQQAGSVAFGRLEPLPQ